MSATRSANWDGIHLTLVLRFICIVRFEFRVLRSDPRVADMVRIALSAYLLVISRRWACTHVDPGCQQEHGP